MADQTASPEPAAGLCICLVYSPRPAEVLEHELRLPEGATLADALLAGARLMPGVSLPAPDGSAGPAWGIWGKPAKASTRLRDGDRVEWYRPLTVDPKVARRERFAQQGARGTGLFARQRPGGKAGY